ncbi:MAG TPA: hypothetical protein VLA52_06815 [Thermohalobaculum sp.]|nr:hypothetical protein [Thermohalobaculum sp.]
MRNRLVRTAAVLGLAASLAACGGGRGPELTNISTAGSPSTNRVGPVDQHREMVTMRLGERGVVAVFRSGECGARAPDFTRMMQGQVEDGLRVPEGIILYDAGIADYESSRCGTFVPARAIGVIAAQTGRYELRFFGGEVVRTVVVR